MALQDILAELAVNMRLDTAQFSAGVSKAEAQTSRLERRLQTFQKRAGGIGKTLASLGGGLVAGFAAGFGVQALVRATGAALEYAGSLAEVAQQVGVTAKDLQVLRFAGGQVGISTEEMDKALQKFTKSLGDARNGSAEAIKTFKALGFNDADIAKLDAHQALLKTADGIAKVGDRATRASPEVRLFGKAGQQLDPLLSQGSRGMNELARAAEELGIVLSDEQIRKADETADKLTALKTVLSARIAGVVADNSGAILSLASALGTLVSSIGDAINGWKRFVAEVKGGAAFIPLLLNPATFAIGAPLYDNAANRAVGGSSSVTVKLPPARPVSAPPPPGGGLGNFLAGEGGGKKGPSAADLAEKAMRERLAALTKAHDYDERELRAQEDILRAQQEISHDYVERTSIGVQLLDLDRQNYKAQLDYEVQQNKISKGAEGISQAQADTLLAMYDRADAAKRTALLDTEELDRQETFNRLEAVTFDLKRAQLEGESSLAETAAARRKVELEILDLANREKKERLERIIKESKDWADIEAARRELAAMPAQAAADRANVLKGTRGPGEDFLATLPTTAAKMNEALERVQVEGLQGLEQGILDVITGVKSMGDAFRDVAKQILTDLLRIGIQRAIIAPLANALFGAAGGLAGARAAGGPVLSGSAYLVGEKGPEIFMPHSTGKIISNDSSRRMMRDHRGGGVMQNFYVSTPDANSFHRSQRQILTSARRRLGTS